MVSRQQWEHWAASAGRSSLEQSWAYGNAVATAQKCEVQRGVVRDGERPLALFQVFHKYGFLPLRWHQALRGPVILPAGAGQQGPILRAIKAGFRLRDRRLLLWVPEFEDGSDSETLLMSCGWRRMTTGYSTVWLDLARPEKEVRNGLHGKWRNALVGAERGPLRCDAGHDARHLDWLLANYAAFRKRKAFAGPTSDLIKALTAFDPEAASVLTALKGNDPLAAILLVRHGASATYYISYTSPEGRRHGAHNLLLWHAMLELKAEGVRWLDLGGVNAAAPGIARFKLGMGGDFVTLTGSYL